MNGVNEIDKLRNVEEKTRCKIYDECIEEIDRINSDFIKIIILNQIIMELFKKYVIEMRKLYKDFQDEIKALDYKNLIYSELSERCLILNDCWRFVDDLIIQFKSTKIIRTYLETVKIFKNVMKKYCDKMYNKLQVIKNMSENKIIKCLNLVELEKKNRREIEDEFNQLDNKKISESEIIVLVLEEEIKKLDGLELSYRGSIFNERFIEFENLIVLKRAEKAQILITLNSLYINTIQSIPNNFYYDIQCLLNCILFVGNFILDGRDLNSMINFFCNYCYKKMKSKSRVDIHLTSSEHLNKIIKYVEKCSYFICLICMHYMYGLEGVFSHLIFHISTKFPLCHSYSVQCYVMDTIRNKFLFY